MNLEKQIGQYEKIILIPEQQKIFERNIKKGIYHALYEREWLTEWQLNYLLNQVER